VPSGTGQAGGERPLGLIPFPLGLKGEKEFCMSKKNYLNFFEGRILMVGILIID
jgi:hypothetical protein